jgi:hypothetical protein
MRRTSGSLASATEGIRRSRISECHDTSAPHLKTRMAAALLCFLMSLSSLTPIQAFSTSKLLLRTTTRLVGREHDCRFPLKLAHHHHHHPRRGPTTSTRLLVSSTEQTANNNIGSTDDGYFDMETLRGPDGIYNIETKEQHK